MMEIKSSQNAKIKAWMKLHQKKYRDQEKMFFVEGEHLIQEALKSGCVVTILVRMEIACPFDHEQIIFVSDQVMDKLSKNVSQVNFMAICKKIAYTQKKETRIVLLDGVQDPGNVGTIIRTAYSFGFDSVYLSKTSADLYNEKTIRSTQGAMFHIRVECVDLFEKVKLLQAQNCFVLATSLHEASGLQEFDNHIPSVAFIFGNEGNGVSHSLLKQSDANVFIEMTAFESLNVGVAAGICLYKFRK